MLVLEIKGEDTGQDRTRRSALAACVQGVNAQGGIGTWAHGVTFEKAQIHHLFASVDADTARIARLPAGQ